MYFPPGTPCWEYLPQIVNFVLLPGFEGCLLWVKIDDVKIPLGSSVESNSGFEISRQISPQGDSIPVCERSDFCVNVDCPDQTTCLSLVDQHKCVDMTSCADNPCQHGTLCIPDDRIPSIDFKCDCGLYFGGKNCEVPLRCEENETACEQRGLTCVGSSDKPYFECVVLPSNQNGGKNAALEIALGVSGAIILGILVIAILVFACCCCRRRQICCWRTKNTASKLKNEPKVSSITPMKEELSNKNRSKTNFPDVIVSSMQPNPAENFKPVTDDVQVEDIDQQDFDPFYSNDFNFPRDRMGIPVTNQKPSYKTRIALDSNSSHPENLLYNDNMIERVITPQDHMRMSTGSHSPSMYLQDPGYQVYQTTDFSSPQPKMKSQLSMTSYIGNEKHEKQSSFGASNALMSTGTNSPRDFSGQVGKFILAKDVSSYNDNHQGFNKKSSRGSGSSHSSFPMGRMMSHPITQPAFTTFQETEFPHMLQLRHHQEDTINEEYLSASRSDNTDTFTNDGDKNFTGSEYDLDAKIEKSMLPRFLEKLPEDEPDDTEYASTISQNRTDRSSSEPRETSSSTSSSVNRFLYSPNLSTHPNSLFNAPFENAVEMVLNDTDSRFTSYGAMFHGRYQLNFSELSPVFQDVANLPDVPELQEEDDEDTLYESNIFLKV